MQKMLLRLILLSLFVVTLIATENALARVQPDLPVDSRTKNGFFEDLFFFSNLTDLAIDSLTIKDNFVENREGIITAVIRELGGVKGATADVLLKDGNTVLDRVKVSVDPNSTTKAKLKTIREKVGPVELTVSIENVQPGDNDLSNNEKSITVDVMSISELLAQNENLNFVFDINSLPTITVEISAEEWNKLLGFYDVNPLHKEEVKADFIFEKDGNIEQVDNIGFRIRGSRFSRVRPEGEEGDLHDSVSPDWHQAHFKISFTKFDKDLRFRGLRAIKLKFFKDEEMFVREVYSDDLFKRFGVWTANFASYAKLFIKIEGDVDTAFFGVYSMIEAIDKEYIQDRFGKKNDEGFLWKCRPPADLSFFNLNDSRIGIENVSPLNDEDSIRPAYNLKTNQSDLESATAQLTEFIEDLHTKEGDDFVDWVQSATDVDLLLRATAVNVVLGKWDSYWINTNNYYMYFDENGKMFFIPFDHDSVMGTSLILDNTGTQDVMKYGTMNSSRPLVYKLLSVPQFREKYKEYLKELIDSNNDLFAFDRSVARINTWHDMIRSSIDNDTGELTEIKDLPPVWSNATFYRLLSGDDSGAEPEANWFKTRSRFALDQISADEGVSPDVAPITAELFLIGSFNDWVANEAYKFDNSAGMYSLEVPLASSARTQEFRISDESGNDVTNFGAPVGASRITIDKRFHLFSEFSDPNLRDVGVKIETPGIYRFEFDVTDSSNPVLLVTFVNEDESIGAIAVPAFEEDIFLEGDMNGWAAKEEFKFDVDDESGNIYSLDAEIAQGTYKFKIVNESWSIAVIGGRDTDSVVTFGEALTLKNDKDSPNLSITIPVDGVYRFSMDASSTNAPILTVTQL